MSPNMSALDRIVRAVVAVAAVSAAVAIDPGSATATVLVVFVGVLVATSAIGFCPLYALFRFDSRGRRPLPH